MSLPAVSLEQFLGLLNSVTKVGANWQAKCPGHEDGRASLSIGPGRNGNVLLKCFAGCSFEQILAPLNLSPQQLFAPAPSRDPFKKILTATYDYRDAAGALVFQVCRFEPKDFRQRRPDPARIGQWIWDMKGVTRVPYRLNELQGQQTVYVAEGEKDVDALWALGLPATTNAGGASKWKDTDSMALKAAGVTRIVLLPDNDGPGRKHIDAVAKSVKSVGIAIMRADLPNIPIKGDVSDWLAAGGTRDELQAIVTKALWVIPKGIVIDVPPPLDPERDPARWHQTDLGAAEAFAHRYGDQIRYDHLRERWLVWDTHRWRPDATREVCRLAHAHARSWQAEAVTVADQAARETLSAFTMRLERRSGIDNMISMANALLPIADDGKEWDTNDWLLGCHNGVVDLKTGVRRDGLPADRMTMQMGCEYQIAALCPRWILFLEQIFEDDAPLIAYVQRALGYSLTGNMREQCFFMCVGSGSNGKSTFLTALEAVWGDYGYTTDMRTFATVAGTSDTTQFDLAELADRRLVLASETKTNSRLNEHALKNFTGGEKINAARKYGHPFEYLPVGKIWVGVNHQPRVYDDSFGFWRRVRIIPFNKIFSGSTDNQNLRDELRAEAPGILAWAVRGCLAWQDVGLLPPASIVTATDAYQQAEDPLTEFLLERTEADTNSSVSAVALYSAYRSEWASDHGLSERERLTSTSFGRLASRRFETKHTERGKRYIGIRLIRRPTDLLSELGN